MLMALRAVPMNGPMGVVMMRADLVGSGMVICREMHPEAPPLPDVRITHHEHVRGEQQEQPGSPGTSIGPATPPRASPEARLPPRPASPASSHFPGRKMFVLPLVSARARARSSSFAAFVGELRAGCDGPGDDRRAHYRAPACQSLTMPPSRARRKHGGFARGREDTRIRRGFIRNVPVGAPV
jgi:hypothetical protein